tara:strand:- start:464 stop:946 length:483 start_codon:yes stop_codon:yes gene_type:complete
MSSRRMARKADERYDAKEAYNKNLSGKARLHYLENDIHDKGMSMKSPMNNMNHEAMKGKEKHNHMMVHHPAKPPKGKSPASMKSPMQKESAKQERKNLMKDNPVDKDASGKRKSAGEIAKKAGKAALKGAAAAMVPGIGAAVAAGAAGRAIGKKLLKKKK